MNMRGYSVTPDGLKSTETGIHVMYKIRKEGDLKMKIITYGPCLNEQGEPGMKTDKYGDFVLLYSHCVAIDEERKKLALANEKINALEAKIKSLQADINAFMI